MKKIVFVLPNMALGGTEQSLLSLLDTISKDDYNVTLLLFKAEGELLSQIPKEINVVEVPDYCMINSLISMPPFKLMTLYIKQKRLFKALNIFTRHFIFRIFRNRYSYYKYVLKEYLFTEPFDTAIAYLGPYDFLTAYVLFSVNAKKRIQWIHFDVSKYVFNKRTCKSLYKQFDRINVVSESARDALIKLIPELSDKTYCVKNKISENRIKKLALSESGFEDNFKGIRLLTVGRLSKEKGQDIIPFIASLVKEEKMIFRWYIIGDGPLYRTIEEEIKKNKVDDVVFLMGTKMNPYPFYKESDLYVQPSVHEGYGLTVVEALILGKTVVATNIPSFREIIKDGDNGFLVNNDPVEIASCITKILKGKLTLPDNQFKCCENSMDDYDWDVM